MSKSIKDDNQEILLTGRGVLLFTILSLQDTECNQIKVSQIMQEFCKRIALNGYGKPAMDIYREVLSTSKKQASYWVDKVYGKYINDNDVFSVYNNLNN